jgi:fido (protein-threonine AMPylation protein)
MFGRYRIRRVHQKFLVGCRNLQAGRAYWDQYPAWARALLGWLSPVPVLGLHEGGRGLTQALEQLEANARGQRLDEALLREYHRIVAEVAPDAGQYRKGEAVVAERPLALPGPQKVPAMMKQLELMLAQGQDKLDQPGTPDVAAVLDLALRTYVRLGEIHPFRDGNGRVARLALNHLTRRYGVGYVLLPHLGESDRLWNALGEAHKGKFDAILEVAAASLHRV